MNINLLKTYFKLMIVRNKLYYLYIIISIVLSYIAISAIMIYIDNTLILGSDFIYPSFRYIYISIRTVFIIGGILLIVSQYYNVMKSSIRDYCILKTLGATKNIIRMLIFIQIVFLMIITSPIGLYTGYILSNLIINSLGSFSLNSSSKDLINSSNTFYLIAGIASCIIIGFGIYLEWGVRKMRISSFILGNTAMNKEVGFL